MNPQEALSRIIGQGEISHDEMVSLMRQIMGGEVSPVMISAIMIGLRVKRESVGEISAAAEVMRELATKVEIENRQNLVDTCGTGGTQHIPSISPLLPHLWQRQQGRRLPSTEGDQSRVNQGVQMYSSHSGLI